MPNLDLISIIDVESTGLNPITDEVIELGCILYSLSHNTVLQQVSTLVHVNKNLAENVNGISAEAANSLDNVCHVFPLETAIRTLIQDADAVVAHKAAFDKAFISPYLDRFKADKLNWIDTMAITWPRAIRQGCNLVELALAYSVPVWSNHRALTDCQLLSHIIQREPRAAELLAKELEPKVWATWASTPADKQGHARAKAAGFRWNDKNCPASGVWSRLMHPDDIAHLPFEVATMEAFSGV